MTASVALGRRLVANTLHAASGRSAQVVLWLVFTPPVLRALGSEAYGVWSLFLALTGYLTALDFGLAQGTLRNVAAARERGDVSGGAGFATVAALGYVGLGAVWLALAVAFREPLLDALHVPVGVRPGAAFACVASAMVFTLAGLANIGMATMQGGGRFELANLVLLAVTLVLAAGLGAVLWAGLGLRGLVAASALAWFAGAVLALTLAPRAVAGFRWRRPARPAETAREVVRFGGPMQLASLLSVAHTHLDKFLIARFAGLATVTTYELGFRVATAASTVPQLLLLAVLPAASALHASGRGARLRELHDRGARYVMSCACVVTATLLGTADRLLSVWVGPDHADAALALRGLAVTAFVALATGMGTALARGIGRTDLEAGFAGVALALHAALSLWLVPVYGLPGALVAITMANLAGATLFLVLLARALRWPIVAVLGAPLGIPVAAATAGAAAGAALDRVLPVVGGVTGWAALVLVAGVSCAVSGGLVLALRYLRPHELRALLERRAEEVSA